MDAIPVTTLRWQTSAVLQRVARGESIEVWVHRERVAVIGPPDDGELRLSESELRDLAVDLGEDVVAILDLREGLSSLFDVARRQREDGT